MEIHFPSSIGAVERANAARSATRDTRQATDEVTFENTRALRTALSLKPDVRADVVARAKSLVADENYPPMETIMKISHLLALKLQAQGNPISEAEVRANVESRGLPPS